MESGARLPRQPGNYAALTLVREFFLRPTFCAPQRLDRLAGWQGTWVSEIVSEMANPQMVPKPAQEYCVWIPATIYLLQEGTGKA